MDINSSIKADISSLRQAIGIYNIKKSMNSDQESVNTILKSLESNRNKMESSVTPHKGQFINKRV